MTDCYAVMGNPIAQSRSPEIHHLFANQFGFDLSYKKILVPKGRFREHVGGFFETGGRGLNITVPFKLEAYALASSLSASAEQAEAVNTLHLNEQGEFCGHNTDGAGLVRDLQKNHGFQLRDKRILIIGAGGAVRGVLGPIMSERPADVVITNRTFEKAELLAKKHAGEGSINAIPLEQVGNRKYDLLINGTSASLSNDIPALKSGILGEHVFCYDMMYGAQLTTFLQWANSNGVVNLADGLGMLVEQAAESFCIWRGVQPETTAVIKQLRQAITTA